MYNLIQKNVKIYFKNYQDFLSILVRPYLYTLPYFLFLKYSNDSKSFIIISTLLVYIISCSVINPNFEIFKDVLNNKHLNILLSKTSFIKYVFSHIIFWMIIINLQIVSILFFYYFNDLLFFDFSNVIIFIFVYVLLYVNIFNLTILLSYLTIKLKIFQYSSIITNVVLLFSGSLFNVFKTKFWLAYLSPFAYAINILRSIFIKENYLNNGVFYLIISKRQMKYVL